MIFEIWNTSLFISVTLEIIMLLVNNCSTINTLDSEIYFKIEILLIETILSNSDEKIFFVAFHRF